MYISQGIIKLFIILAFSNKDFIFLEWFQVHSKIGRKVQRFPIRPLALPCMAAPVVSIRLQKCHHSQ